MARGRRATWVCLLVPPLTLAALVASAWFRSSGPVRHVDEPAWVASSYYFDLLRRGDFQHPDWSFMTARDSPPVGKYLFGAALTVAGHPVRTIEPLAAWQERYRSLPGAWGTGRASERRAAVAARLAPDVRSAVARGSYDPFLKGPELTICRGVAFAFGVLSALVVAAIGLFLRGPATGLIAGLLYAVHPLVLMASALALFDIIAVAFSASAVWCLAALMLPGVSLGKAQLPGILGGLFMALAVGTKMNALIVVFLAVVTTASLALRRDSRRLAFAPVLGVFLGFVLFLGMNPACHMDPLGALSDLVVIPKETTQVQAGFLPDYLPDAPSRWRALGRLAFGHVGLMAVIGVAAVFLTGLAWRSRGPRIVIVAWFWLAVLLVGHWLPFPWERYALPVVPPAALVSADALVGAAGWAWARLHRQDVRQAANTFDARAR